MGLYRKKPKKDCFAYRVNEIGRERCDALNDLYCCFDTKKCPFYKQKKNGDGKK